MDYTVIKIRFKNHNFDFKEVSPFAIHKFLDTISTTWDWIHKRFEKKMLVFKERDKANVQKFLKIKTFYYKNQNYDVKFEENISHHTSDGVIYCRPLLVMSDEYLLQKLVNQNVKSLYRFKKKSMNGIYETGLFFLTFTGNVKADYVVIHGFTLPVTSSFQDDTSTQCKHCFMIGHKASNCFRRHSTICPKCNKNVKNHEANCQIKCINCGGDHLSSSTKDCSFIRNAVAIQKIKIKLLHQHERIEIKAMDVENLYKKLNEVNTKIRKYEKYCIIYG